MVKLIKYTENQYINIDAMETFIMIPDKLKIKMYFSSGPKEFQFQTAGEYFKFLDFLLEAK